MVKITIEDEERKIVRECELLHVLTVNEKNEGSEIQTTFIGNTNMNVLREVCVAGTLDFVNAYCFCTKKDKVSALAEITYGVMGKIEEEEARKEIRKGGHEHVRTDLRND